LPSEGDLDMEDVASPSLDLFLLLAMADAGCPLQPDREEAPSPAAQPAASPVAESGPPLRADHASA
jgi:hypothetical protein